MPTLRLVMMGTGEFALPTFVGLCNTEHLVAALYTQPDRTGPGRHQGHANPMRQHALERGIPVFQPVQVNAPDALSQIQELHPDVLVVAAYGQILSSALLALPRLGAINVHASLLPKYRGAAPVAYAILHGESETGVSIIQILPRLDAGPILATAQTPIGALETAGELEDRLAQLAVPLIPPVLAELAAGTARPISQSDSMATRAPKLTKEMGAIDWSRSAAEIDCQVRALQPWPKAYTWVETPGKPRHRIVVLEVRPARASSDSVPPPGTVVSLETEGLGVQTGSGPVELVRVQPDGKRGMTGGDYLRGNRVQPGHRLHAAASSDPVAP
ncbi:MAG: methionyl-tRNA formyltransferase [Planctomycetales bacterium]